MTCWELANKKIWFTVHFSSDPYMKFRWVNWSTKYISRQDSLRNPVFLQIQQQKLVYQVYVIQ